MAVDWLKRWFGRWSNFDSATSLAGYILLGFTALTGLTVAGMVAWATSTYDWYWSTFQWAGIAAAFLLAWLVLSVGFFLFAHAVRAWRCDSNRPSAPSALEREAASGGSESQSKRTCSLVSGIRLSRAEDVTSRWFLSFQAGRPIGRLTVGLELQFYTVRPRKWGGRTKHVVLSRDGVIEGQTFSLQVVDDRPCVGEGRAPHWNIGASPDGSDYVQGVPSHVRGQFEFIGDGSKQTFKFIGFPRNMDEAIFLLGEDVFDPEGFWSKDEQPLDLRLTRGARKAVQRAS
jgi:hypothetical protein